MDELRGRFPGPQVQGAPDVLAAQGALDPDWAGGPAAFATFGVARFVEEGDKSFHINKLDMVEAPGVGLCLVNGATPLT
jgi:hypothetical protein